MTTKYSATYTNQPTIVAIGDHVTVTLNYYERVPSLSFSERIINVDVMD